MANTICCTDSRDFLDCSLDGDHPQKYSMLRTLSMRMFTELASLKEAILLLVIALHLPAMGCVSEKEVSETANPR